ncbi:MAG: formate/nitrite transporter family protein [Bacillota bacterium]
MADIVKPDAYTPVEIARKLEQLGVTKATLPTYRTIILSILAGAFVAMGGMFYFVAMAGWKGSFGVGQVFGGLVFNLGLCLIAIGGAELFTGNTLLSIAFASRKISLWQMVRNWALVWFFNGVGALLMVGLAYWAQHWAGGDYLVGLKVLSVGATKAALPFEVAFARGIVANIFVTLAVWVYSGGKTVVDKIAAMILPITGFVAVGAEHSIANFFFIPYALLLKANPAVATLPGAPLEKLPYLTLNGFGQNLVASTLGNLVGGALCVGLVYWMAYLWEPKSESEAALHADRKAS